MLGRLFKKYSPETSDSEQLHDELGYSDHDAPDAASGSVAPTEANRAISREADIAANTEKIRVWLIQLPEQYRPYRLSDVYPRIALKMLNMWHSPDTLRLYFRELAIDDRGDRQGFQDDVAFEIFRLIRHFEEMVEAGQWPSPPPQARQLDEPEESAF